jgi:prolyl 4-hydroxylase
MEMKIEAISTHPKAFLIKNFLNDIEMDEILHLSGPSLQKSKIIIKDGVQAQDQQMSNNIRTSSNAWLNRFHSPITDSVYRRAAEVLKLPDSVLNHNTNTENLQIVRYLKGEFYSEHYDWSQNEIPYTRYITLLIYLNEYANATQREIHHNRTTATSRNMDFYDEPEDSDEQDEDGLENPVLYEGGETAFFRGNNGKGFAIHPGKGSAVLFYNLLEDGNGDELALHSSLPVKDGIKWLANLWIWDPTLPPKLDNTFLH